MFEFEKLFPAIFLENLENQKQNLIFSSHS